MNETTSTEAAALRAPFASRRSPFWTTPPEGVAAVFRDWRSTARELDEIFRSDPRFVPLISPIEARGVPYAREIAHVKRFAERWRSDPRFRAELHADPQGATARHGIDVDPEELRPFWDDAAAARAKDDPSWKPSLLVERHRLFAREKLLHRERLRVEECVPADERHRLWRNRQIQRSLGHLGPRHYQGIVHAPFAIELSEGCSVGCWFCGVSAAKKGADFRYSDENAELWRGVLRVLRDAVGPAAATGFCYWATDPLDNPDYERFCTDFADVCGRFPQTTTAQPHKDVERVKRLLRLSEERGCTINRFSILTLGIFERVMASYTAEELLHCELVPLNAEAVQTPSHAGRARGSERLQRLAQRSRDATSGRATELGSGEEYPLGTIACISGFLLNMVHRSVRLITPCPAGDRWPEGYWVLEEARFDDASDLASLVEGMKERHMRTALRAGDPVRFRPDVRFEPGDRGFVVHGRGARTAFAGPPLLREVGSAIASGDATAGGIAIRVEDETGRPAALTMNVLNQVFDAGVLDEEPCMSRTGSPARAKKEASGARDDRDADAPDALASSPTSKSLAPESSAEPCA